MLILVYPEYEKILNPDNLAETSGPVIKTMEDFNEKNPKQYSRLKSYFKKIKEGSNRFELNDAIRVMRYENNELKKFPNSVLWEIRVPPTDRRHGVFRGYCKHFKVSTLKKWKELNVFKELDDDDDVLIIFSAEIKIGDSDNSQAKIKNAEDRCKVIEEAERNYDKKHNKERKR